MSHHDEFSPSCSKEFITQYHLERAFNIRVNDQDCVLSIQTDDWLPICFERDSFIYLKLLVCPH